MIKCIAFDCFGTVFDMSGVSRDEIKAYVEHVRKDDFTPFEFPQSWWELKSHPDAAEGIMRLQHAGYICVTLSNGDSGLIWRVSKKAGIQWNYVVDLRAERVYKPNQDAYRTVEKILGHKPSETLMVTANPTFGDIEGAASIGMKWQVIRRGYPNNIIELADKLTRLADEPDDCRRTIRDYPMSDALKEMIAQCRWSPEHSGWRPFQSAEEAEIIRNEDMFLRGSNWDLKVVCLGESSGLFLKSLGYNKDYIYVKEMTYDELFRFAKVVRGGAPCGRPIQLEENSPVSVEEEA